MSNMISSRSARAYIGTNAVNPPNWFINNRNPTTKDSKNYSLGDLWLNKLTGEAWALVSLAGNMGSHGVLIADWIRINNVANSVTITGNDSIPVSPNNAGNINLVGDGTEITISGDPLNNLLVMSLINPSSNQLTLTGDTGGAVSSGLGNNVNLLGGTGILVSGSPGTNTLAIVAGEGLSTEFDTDAGTAIPSSQILNIVGGSNINTSGASDSITVNLNDTITGITDLTVNNLTVTTNADFSYLTEGVLQSDGSGNITSSKGTDGQLLIGSTAGAPAWANITAGANISITNGANSITISKGTGPGGNGLELIETINSYSGSFHNLPSKYKSLVLVIHKMGFGHAAALTQVLVQLSDNNGVSYYTTNYTSGLWGRESRNLDAPITQTTTQGYMVSCLNTRSFGLNQKTSCTAYLYNLNDANTPKLMNSQYISVTYGGVFSDSGFASGVYKGTLSGRVDAIRVTLTAPPPSVGVDISYMSLYGLTS